MKVVVIIPTYNEKENIGPLIEDVERVFKQIKGHHMHILIVDDNSPDGTANVVKQKQKKFKNLHLITGKKEGLGKAYLRGMKHASEKLKAEVMFEMDADFQHNPNLIPAFIKKIDQGYDLVIGSRYIPGGSIPNGWGAHRKIFSVFGNLIVRTMLFNFSHHDWTTGYRALRTPLYNKVSSELGAFKGYTFQVSFLHKAFLKGAKVAEVPMQFLERTKGESKIGSAEYIFNLIKYLIISDLTNPPRFLRFLVVGTTGFLIQTAIFTLAWKSFHFAPGLATAIGAEFAIISNFILNNFWTFSDRRLKLSFQIILPKFISFNILSLGSVFIQWLTVTSFTNFINDSDIITWVAYITGIFLGLIWNYTVYNKIIWKKKK